MSFSARAKGRAAACAALALGVGACGGAVHDESVAAEPIVVIHGHVDVAALTRAHPDVPLLGALVWGAVPAVNPLCLLFDEPALRPACPDPYGVFYGPIERAAAVDANGDFAITLEHLPKASVSVGDEVTRIAWGSLVVVEDVDGDGQPSLLAGILDGSGRRDQGEPPPLATDPDVIVASSFHTLRTAQTRVAFREGGFVESSVFYPAPGCAPPPLGFSIYDAPAYDDAVGAGCGSRGLASVIEVAPLSPDESRAFACRSVQRSGRVRQPRADNPPPEGVEPLCLSHDIFALIYPGTCERMVAYALKGCATDPLCAKPEWDQTPLPPTWWPCL